MSFLWCPRFRSFPTRLLAPLLLSLGSVACGSSDEDDAPAQRAVVDNYAVMVTANYADTLSTAKSLKARIHEFVEAPSAESLEAAKQAWLKARDPYGLSEAYRFYQGPIDNDDTDDDIPDGPEPLLNSWPLDEKAIDYVVDEPDSGIINSPEEFPTIDAETLSAENAKESETAITTGYHAIEFLLWGQDLSADGPGARPYTDYVVGDGGTAKNQDRRGQYLVTIADLLVDDLSSVNDAWLGDADNYRARFVALAPRDALGKIMLGMGSLSGAELSGERMNVALKFKDQEDEHSCFSDNTLADLRNNATSIQDVLLGRYRKIQGPALVDLIAKKDAALAQKLQDGIQSVLDDIAAVDEPFDQAILSDADGKDTPERKRLLAAVEALRAFTTDLQAAAELLNVNLNLQSE